MFLLDGVNDLGSFIGNYNFEPIVDTVQEFKVQSHNDQAQFGQVVGGVVNVVTKSGNNSFHGSLWEFLRNSDFDARWRETKRSRWHYRQIRRRRLNSDPH